MENRERSVLVFIVIFFMRRASFVFTVLVIRESLFTQLASQNFISLLMLIYLQWYKPLDSKFSNNIETFNEGTIISLTYFLFCFTDFVPDPATRDGLGNYYNYVGLANIAVHLFIMLASSFVSIRLSIRKRCHLRKLKRIAKERQL